MTDPTISQDAREAAATLFLLLPELGDRAARLRWADEVRAGQLTNDPIVQAFARFEAHLRTPAPMLMTQEWLDKKVDADPVAEVEACTPASGEAGEMVRPRDHWDADWWKPEPSDPFWMLEAEDGEWLKNRDSLLGTRDATKAIRFPTEETAMGHPARMKPGSKWWNAKATEHLWCDFPETATRPATDTEAMRLLREARDELIKQCWSWPDRHKLVDRIDALAKGRAS